MFGLSFFKGQPTDYVIKYVGGRVTQEGLGRAFYYLTRNTQIVVVPTSTQDANFVFNELTNNFQSVTLQGQFTYRIVAPAQAAAQLNFTYDPRHRTYAAKDPESLPGRIANIIQIETRRELGRLTLEETLRQSQEIAGATLARIHDQSLLQTLGVELTSLYFLAAKPTPEIARALEAQYRETLLRLADEAIYARRGAAIAEERKIKESERATKIALEEQRRALIALEGENALREAEYQAQAAEKTLAVYRAMDPRSILALALKEMGANAERIGSLNITTETLAALLNGPPLAGGRGAAVMAGHDKVVIVTKKTALEELIEQFNTREQARFYLEHSGVSFEEYEASHAAYQTALAHVKGTLPPGTRAQWVERAFVPTFTFGEGDLVLTVGPDGLVVNTAKYLDGQPLFAVNPDPARIDGVLLPFHTSDMGGPLRLALRGEMGRKRITMARVTLNDGQTLDAVNDFFIGRRTHQSARYRLALAGREENQSSSGIIVSTGAGSTGWLRSVLAGAASIVETFVPSAEVAATRTRYGFDWEADYLCYSVREPFESRVSSAGLVFGHIEAGQSLEVTSQMPQSGVIFSDGVEEDALEFNSGRVARIGLADKRVSLIVPGQECAYTRSVTSRA